MEKQQTFEMAYERLEQILEKMNSKQVSLDEALSLYEEADALITTCQKKLTEAEKRVEILMKNREGNVVLNEKGTPQTESFSPSNPSIL